MLLWGIISRQFSGIVKVINEGVVKLGKNTDKTYRVTGWHRVNRQKLDETVICSHQEIPELTSDYKDEGYSSIQFTRVRRPELIAAA